jgi:hypothetical protein
MKVNAIPAMGALTMVTLCHAAVGPICGNRLGRRHLGYLRLLSGWSQVAFPFRATATI